MGFRAFIVGIPLVAVTVADSRVGVGRRGPLRPRVHPRARRLARHVLRRRGQGSEAPPRDRHDALPRAARGRARLRGARAEKFNPASEWTLKPWVDIQIGPIDMSINKAVAYLMLGTVVSCVIGIVLMRVKTGSEPTKRQAIGEIDLRDRPGADRRAGAADEGDRPLVPLRRDADDLHLGRQHARLHPAAALRREVDDLRGRGADAGASSPRRRRSR